MIYRFFHIQGGDRLISTINSFLLCFRAEGGVQVLPGTWLGLESGSS